MIATVIISIILVGVVIAIFSNIIKNKKHGNSGCSCGCSNCNMSSMCHGKNNIE